MKTWLDEQIQVLELMVEKHLVLGKLVVEELGKDDSSVCPASPLQEATQRSGKTHPH